MKKKLKELHLSPQSFLALIRKQVQVAAYKNESTQFIALKLIFVKVAECDILNLVVLKNMNIMLHTLDKANNAGFKYGLMQVMPLVISLFVLLFSLSKSSFLYVDQKNVQSSFYKFDLSATSLSSQKKK